MGAVRVVDQPPVVAEFAAEYWDSFAIAAVPAVAPREWARLSLRGADGVFGSVVWHRLLGFDLAAAATPGTLVGWQISRDSDDEYVLDVDGSLMAGRMVFAFVDNQVVWTTMLKFHNTTARRIWTLAGNAHRAIAPRALSRARRAMS